MKIYLTNSFFALKTFHFFYSGWLQVREEMACAYFIVTHTIRNYYQKTNYALFLTLI